MSSPDSETLLALPEDISLLILSELASTELAKFVLRSRLNEAALTTICNAFRCCLTCSSVRRNSPQIWKQKKSFYLSLSDNAKPSRFHEGPAEHLCFVETITLYLKYPTPPFLKMLNRNASLLTELRLKGSAEYLAVLPKLNREIVRVIDIQIESSSSCRPILDFLASGSCPKLRKITLSVESLQEIDPAVFSNAPDLSMLHVILPTKTPDFLFPETGPIAIIMSRHKSTLSYVRVEWKGDSPLDLLRQFTTAPSLGTFDAFEAAMNLVPWISPTKLRLGSKNRSLIETWLRNLCRTIPAVAPLQALMVGLGPDRVAKFVTLLASFYPKATEAAAYVSWSVELAVVLLVDPAVKSFNKLKLVAAMSFIASAHTVRGLMAVAKPKLGLHDIIRLQINEQLVSDLLDDVEWSSNVENFNPHAAAHYLNWSPFFLHIKKLSTMQQIVTNPNTDTGRGQLLRDLFERISAFALNYDDQIELLLLAALGKMGKPSPSTLFHAFVGHHRVFGYFQQSSALQAAAGALFNGDLSTLFPACRDIVQEPHQLEMLSVLLGWAKVPLSADAASEHALALLLHLWVRGIELNTVVPRTWMGGRTGPPDDTRIFRLLFDHFPLLPKPIADFVLGQHELGDIKAAIGDPEESEKLRRGRAATRPGYLKPINSDFGSIRKQIQAAADKHKIAF